MEILEYQRKVLEMKDRLDEACKKAVGVDPWSISRSRFLCCKRGWKRSDTV